MKNKKLTLFPNKTPYHIRTSVKKSVCPGGRLVTKYRPEDYREVTRVTIDRFIAAYETKSIVRIKSNNSTVTWQWLNWN